MAPVVLMTSSSAALGSTYSNTQSIASSGPAMKPSRDIAGSAPASGGPGSEVSAAWGVGCKTVRATTMAATTRPAAIQNARWYPNMFTPRGAQHRTGPQLDDRHDRGLDE